MSRKIVSGFMVTLLLTGILTLAFDIQPVESESATYGPFISSTSQDLSSETTPESFYPSAVDIIDPQPGQFSDYSQTQYYSNGTAQWYGWWNTSYISYVQPHVINTTHTIEQPYMNGTLWCTVDTTTRWVTDTSPDFVGWNQTWYIIWIERNVTIGSVINWFTSNATIVGSKILNVAGQTVDAWIANSTLYPGTYDLSYYDKQSGLLVDYEAFAGYLAFRHTLTATNIPIGGISIYLDKYTYSAGDTMHLGLNVTNPFDDALHVDVAVWLEKPIGPIYVLLHAHNVTLPADLTYSNPTFQTFVLPGIPLGVYTWHAALLSPTTHSIIVEDTAEWQFITPISSFQIGALLPLTGDLATFGENERVAAEFAVGEVNEFLLAAGASWTLELVVEDTQTDPDIALEKVESLAARGIKLVLGPLSSGEVRAIKTYVDANKILVISHGSTAPDLAIPDDYVFRFSSQDRLGQGPAIGRIMYDDGKRYVIPVWRNDAWGLGLKDAGKTKFVDGLGGTFLTGIGYDPDATEFSTEAADLATKVTNAVSLYGVDQVAVWHISFEEVNAFFTAADDYAVLSTVKWYGSDGTARSGSMLADASVRDFAMAVEYPSTLFAPTESVKWEKVRQHGIDMLGREPDPYAYVAYDIVWVYALSLLAVNEYDSEVVRAVLPTVTENYFGASGWIVLDENGDRIGGDYGIWQILEITPGTYNWQRVGTWIFMLDTVEWY